MKSFLLLSLIAILASTTTACASNATVQIDTSGTTIQLSMPGPNPLVNQPDAQGRVARSLAGLWHGFILPFTLVISFSNRTRRPETLLRPGRIGGSPKKRQGRVRGGSRQNTVGSRLEAVDWRQQKANGRHRTAAD